MRTRMSWNSKYLGACAALAGVAALEGLYGCAGDDGVESFVEENVGEISEAVGEDSDFTPSVCPTAPTCNSSIATVVEPSLIVRRTITHAAMLDANFSLSAVLQQLINQAGATTETPTELYRRLWDTYASSSTQFNEPYAPHCSASANGYPLDCPRPGDSTNAVTGLPGHFRPVALVNRFDLTPLDGSNCGEYRIVYWSNGSSNTGTIIFEAQIPNPNPTCGVEACRPIADFWKSLAGLDEATLGAKLQSFYFTGLPGFRPAIEVRNYGLGATGSTYGASGGQIRTNTISSAGPWQLREFHLGLNTSGVIKLFMQPVTVKNNPFGDLFNIASANANASAFRADFTLGTTTSQVTALAAPNLNNISMNILNQYNSFQSTSQNSAPNNYLTSLPAGASNAFTAAITADVPVSSSLTPNNIVDRATTQSCAGCHLISNDRPLGGGLTWPPSGADGSQFVHIGDSGGISDALKCVFLPHRQRILSKFEQSCGTMPAAIIPSGCQSFGNLFAPQNPSSAQISSSAKSARATASPSTPVGTLGGGSSVN